MGTETLKTVRDRIRGRLRDPNSVIWTDAQLNRYLNMAQIDLQQRLMWGEDYDTTVVTSSTASYTRVNTDRIQNMKYQVYDGTRINTISQYEIDRVKSDWRTDTATIPARLYRSDWNQDAFWPPPAYSGNPAVTFSQESGCLCRVVSDDPTDAITFSQETGIVIQAYSSANPVDDWYFKRQTYANVSSDSTGEVDMVVPPYKNLTNVYFRWPDTLVNDTDLLSFPDWVHWGIEEHAMMLAYEKEGDGNNPKLAQAHGAAYFEIWLPFIAKMKAQRDATPDAATIWESQTPIKPWTNQLSKLTKWWRPWGGRIW